MGLESWVTVQKLAAFSRGSQFDSQHSHVGCQPAATQLPEDLASSAVSICTHVDNTTTQHGNKNQAVPSTQHPPKESDPPPDSGCQSLAEGKTETDRSSPPCLPVSEPVYYLRENEYNMATCYRLGKRYEASVCIEGWQVYMLSLN